MYCSLLGMVWHLKNEATEPCVPHNWDGCRAKLPGSPKCILMAVKLSLRGRLPMPARFNNRSILSRRLELGDVRKSEK